jgi:hypothetical protein
MTAPRVGNRVLLAGISVLLVLSLAACGSSTNARMTATTNGSSASVRAIQALVLRGAWSSDAARKCIDVKVTFSHNDAAWAEADPRFSSASACSQYAGNGYYLVRDLPTGWKVVFDGSTSPPCSLRAPHDLPSIHACTPPPWKLCAQRWNEQTTLPSGEQLDRLYEAVTESFDGQPVAYLRAVGNSCQVLVTVGRGVMQSFSGTAGYDRFGLTQSSPQAGAGWHYTDLNADGTLGPTWLSSP